jgi:hypothetical protein
MQYLVGREVQEIVRSVAYPVMPAVNTTEGVRSHSHDSSFMHSDVLTFYTYTVVPELYFVVVTVSLVSIFIPSGGV